MEQHSAVQEDPEDQFEKIELLGEGAYGQVFKVKHVQNGKIYAAKIVPVENDITVVKKEINILKQCGSPYIVSYHGSFLKSNNLWIIIELCDGGSVWDILQVLQIPLSEQQIATVCASVLKGLEYLHTHKKIHRDIKAGNILLTAQGDVKLADFGVSAQLSNTISKRRTIIGTPYWMAPEVIKETRYDGRADIWSVGITAIEMAQLKPPLAGIHPLRAIFAIPNKPSPTLSEPSKWSKEFNDFIAQCLNKNQDHRPQAKSLLKHPFLRRAKDAAVLKELIDKVNEKYAQVGGREAFFQLAKAAAAAKPTTSSSKSASSQETMDDDSSDDEETGTMIIHPIAIAKSPTTSKMRALSSTGGGATTVAPLSSSPRSSYSSSPRRVAMVAAAAAAAAASPSPSPSSTATAAATTSTAGFSKTIQELTEYFEQLNVEELKMMLETNDIEMEERIMELKDLYTKRKIALESAIQKK